jgi:hypothetical protein
MKTSLFDENDKYTPEALALDREAQALLRPIVERCKKQGISLRDLDYVLSGAVNEVILLELI